MAEPYAWARVDVTALPECFVPTSTVEREARFVMDLVGAGVPLPARLVYAAEAMLQATESRRDERI